MAEIDISTLMLSVEEIAVRLALAMLIGAIIGIEREFSHRPAGLRTHMLVALGACAVMITSQMLFCQYRPYGATADPGRLSAQVIAGVGFLGAGTILREGVIVKGLTTAASIWTVACLGIAVGAGYYPIAFISLAFILITLTFVEWLQHKIFRNRFSRYEFSLKCRNIAHILEFINNKINSNDARMNSLHVEDLGEGICLLEFKADFAGRHSVKRYNDFLSALSEEDYISSVKVEKL